MLGKILRVMLAIMMKVTLAQMMVGMLLTKASHGDDDGHYSDAVETNCDGNGSEGFLTTATMSRLLTMMMAMFATMLIMVLLTIMMIMKVILTTVMMVMFVERERRKLDKSGRHAEPSTHFVAC